MIFNILCGLPSSGKSTWAASHIAANPECALICPDHLREQLTGDASDQSSNYYIFDTLVPQHIRANAGMRRDAVFDSTAYCRRNRRNIIKLAKENGYKVVARVFNLPFDECVRRNEARERVVPRHVLERMARNWEDPALDEGFDEIVYHDYSLDKIAQ
jgi:predicted kinase